MGRELFRKPGLSFIGILMYDCNLSFDCGTLWKSRFRIENYRSPTNSPPNRRHVHFRLHTKSSIIPLPWYVKRFCPGHYITILTLCLLYFEYHDMINIQQCPPFVYCTSSITFVFFNLRYVSKIRSPC